MARMLAVSSPSRIKFTKKLGTLEEASFLETNEIAGILHAVPLDT